MESSPRSCAWSGGGNGRYLLLPSVLLRRWTILCHVAVALTLLAAWPHPLLILSAWLLILLSYWRSRVQLARMVGALRQHADGVWEFGGELWQLRDWYGHPRLCILHLRRGWHRTVLVLPVDALSTHGHRRLRAALRGGDENRRPTFERRIGRWVVQRVVKAAAFLARARAVNDEGSDGRQIP